MRAIVTGQVGIDKSPYLENVKRVAREQGHDLEVFHVGKMMYEEAPDVPKGRILNIPKGYGHFYMISRGRNIPTVQTIQRLIFESHKKKVYLSFPMSHVMDLPDTLKEIDQFKADINKHLITFDPADVDEFILHKMA